MELAIYLNWPGIPQEELGSTDRERGTLGIPCLGWYHGDWTSDKLMKMDGWCLKIFRSDMGMSLGLVDKLTSIPIPI